MENKNKYILLTLISFFIVALIIKVDAIQGVPVIWGLQK